ncbi:MAG TPA: nucleotidyl transferase AbiEii/AbiGii toxin family protein [Solirubrobacterales bacterium]|nr:nucleotidyl transferase AbiEii/AbiGii toxin family protein [Solirubrobacterales bacterium]
MDPKDRLPAEWPELDVEEMLRRFVAAGVDFVVVGGIAMMLLGSSRLTRDLDIVFAPDETNLESLGSVLVGLKAQLRDVPDAVPFVPDERTLANVELLTLKTSVGWLDTHRRLDGAPSYDALRRRAERHNLGDFSVLVASPDDMLAMKQAAARPVDRADIEELKAIKRLRAQLGRR